MKKFFNLNDDTTTTYDIYVDGELLKSFESIGDATKAFEKEVASRLYGMYNNGEIDKYAVEDWISIFSEGTYDSEKGCFEPLDLEKEIKDNGKFEYYVDEGPGILFILQEDKLRERFKDMLISDDFER